MKVIKYLFFLLLIAVIGLSIYIATVDGNYDLKQSRIIKAPVEVVYNDVNDFKSWQHWGPWYEMDSTIVASYPEVTIGEGASYTWTGKDGDGTMKTISIIPNKEIIQQIDFGTGTTPEVYWNFSEVEDGTEVTWGMRGENSFMEKGFWLFNGGIEENMLPMYDRGLELLDQHITKKLDEHTFEVKGIIDYGGGFYLYKTASCNVNDIDKNSERMFGDLMAYITENNILPSGKPFSLTHKWDEENNTTMFSACVPVRERINTNGDVLTGHMKTQKTFKTILRGDYKFLYDSWMNSFKAIEEQGLIPINNGEPFEVYIVGPHDTPNPLKWVTEIYIPIE
jgi:effector-binding domain-containing protein